MLFLKCQNTEPPLTSKETIEKRITFARKAQQELRDEGINIFYGLYAGITTNPKQIQEVVKAQEEILRVVGLKMYAGHSTGNMGIIKEGEQKLVYSTLAKSGYRGILAVHCEKESLLNPKVWNAAEPFTHTLARPPESEVESVKDQIRFASEASYRGILHICHVSVPESVSVIEMAQKQVGFKITCGATPHHCMLYDRMMEGEDGLLLKMNPPLRPKEMAETLLNLLRDGKIDWIETDHAPHTLNEKTGKALDKNGNPIYASGIPVYPFYLNFLRKLHEKGISRPRLEEITHENASKMFRLSLPNRRSETFYELSGEYEASPPFLETLK